MKFPLLSQPADLVKQYLKFMAQVQSASPHTLRAYSLDLAQCFELGPINKEALQDLVDGLNPSARLLFPQAPEHASFQYPPSTLSTASRNRKIATTKSFFNWCYQNKQISEDISHHLHCPKVPRKIPHFISVDEVLSILDSFEVGTPLEPQVLFLLLYGCGLRVSEACQLKWQDIQTNSRRLLIKGKGNKERVAAAPAITIRYLEKLKAEQKKNSLSDGTFVFGDKALDSRTAYAWIKNQGQKAGLLNPLHPHALRHSFATHILSSGANLRTLQELLGHESLVATEKYTHLSIDQLARTMDQKHPLGRKVG